MALDAILPIFRLRHKQPHPNKLQLKTSVIEVLLTKSNLKVIFLISVLIKCFDFGLNLL